MPMLTLDFINVGYGDAILIRDHVADYTMLVDCGDISVGDRGPGSQRIMAADFLKQKGVRHLDLLVLTHLHRDHSGGLRQLLPNVSVREFWTNYLPPEICWGKQVTVSPEFSAGARCLLESLNIYSEALVKLREQGTHICLMDKPCQAHVLTEDLQAKVYLEDRNLHLRQSAIWKNVWEGRAVGTELDELDRFINNTSIRLRLSCNGCQIELPGDVYAPCWEKHDLCPCDIVKLPHHGHSDSMTPHLLEMLRPQHAVISVSNTRLDNCPAASVTRLLMERGCQVHFTDAVSSEGVQSSCHPSIHFECT